MTLPSAGDLPVIPVALTPAIVRRDTTTFKLRDRTIRFAVPRAVGQLLAERCDGARSAEALADEIEERCGVDLRAALRALFEAGALGDVNDLGSAVWRFVERGVLGEPGSRVPIEALARDQELQTPPEGPRRVLVTDDSQWRRRLSSQRAVKALGPARLSLATLASLLWSVDGVLDGPAPEAPLEPPARTAPSEGALQPLVVHVALLRAVDDLAPGVYRVTSRRAGEVELTAVAEAPTVQAVFHDPAPLREADGYVVISGSFARSAARYGPGSLPLTLLEAGRAAQNLHLAAAEHGLAALAMHGYQVDALDDVLALPRGCRPLTLVGFGAPLDARPDAPVEARIRRVVALPRRVGTYRLPEPAVDIDRDGSSSHAMAPTRELAELKARAETWEREAFFRLHARPRRRATFAEVASIAVRPEDVLAYAPRQIGRDAPVVPFDPRAVSEWHEVVDHLSGERRLMLADLVGPAQPPGRRPYALATTSGAAAHTSRDAAVLNGLLELVERDAVMITWLNRLARPRVRLASLPRVLRRRVAAIEAQGFGVHVVDLTLDLAPVVLVAVTHEQRPLLACAAGVGVTARDALEHALREAELGFFWQLQNEWCGPILAAAEVRTVADHGAFYKSEHNIRRASFLVRGPEVDFRALERRHDLAAPEDLLRVLDARGLRVLVADLRAGDPLLANAPFEIVKVFVPGLVPITFGYGLAPLGMPRVREAPRACGLVRAATPLSRLNRLPHPMA